MIVEGILANVGKGAMSIGGRVLEVGIRIWSAGTKIVVSYLAGKVTAQPAYASVGYGSRIWTACYGIAGALTVLFFVLGFAKETVDIRSRITPEGAGKLLLRLILAMMLVTGSLSAVECVVDLSAAVTAAVGIDADALINTEDLAAEYDEEMTAEEQKVLNKYGYFSGIYQELEEEEETDYSSWLGAGFLCLIGGIAGGALIAGSAVTIIILAAERIFRMLVGIPLAPIAFSTVAGGINTSQSARAWIRTWAGHALETLVIVLSLQLSFTMSAAAVTRAEVVIGEGAIQMTLAKILTIVMPMLAAAECCKGAQRVVKRCLGDGSL